jgi:hypothetical protein
MALIAEAKQYQYILSENKTINGAAEKQQFVNEARGRREPSWQSSLSSTMEELESPDPSLIPLFDSETQVVPPLEPVAHVIPDQVLTVAENVTTDRGSRASQGLYATLISCGEASKVFQVETQLSLNGHPSSSKDVTRKVSPSLNRRCYI